MNSPINRITAALELHRTGEMITGCNVSHTEVPVADLEAVLEDAARFRALMRCPRIKMQGSAGVDPKTGALKYPEQPGSVHFGAEFWTNAPSEHAEDEPTWGRHALRALADDILAVEAIRIPEKSA